MLTRELQKWQEFPGLLKLMDDLRNSVSKVDEFRTKTEEGLKCFYFRHR